MKNSLWWQADGLWFLPRQWGSLQNLILSKAGRRYLTIYIRQQTDHPIKMLRWVP